MSSRKTQVISNYVEVINSGHGTGTIRVGVRLPANTTYPDRLLRSQAYSVASENHFRNITRLGGVHTDAESDGSLWHRAVFEARR